MGIFRSRLLLFFLLGVPSLWPADSALLFKKILGGSGYANVTAVAADPSGNVIVGGVTSSYDFPVTDGSRNIATHFAATGDAGASWTPLGNLPSGVPWSLVVDGGKPPTWWATGGGGVFQSVDNGATWSEAGPHLPVCDSRGPNCEVLSLAVNPAQPATIYGRSSSGILKTSDGGATWMVLPPPIQNPNSPSYLTLDPLHPDHVFTGVANLHFRSFDGGLTWTQYTPPILDPNRFCSASSPPLAFDKVTPNLAYLADRCGLFRSTDGGVYWKPLSVPDDFVVGPVTHPSKPGTAYAIGSTGVYATEDAGDTWSLILSYRQYSFPRVFAIDPQRPSTILTESMRSLDGGLTWMPWSLRRDLVAFVFDPSHSGTAIAATAGASAAFVAKLSAGGTLLSATLLSGQGGARIVGLSTDKDGNIYVAGGTNSLDFPVTPGALQSTPPLPNENFFAAKFDPDLKPVYSTFLPGFRWVTSIAVDPAGSAVLAGMAPQAPETQWQCLVMKLQPDASAAAYSTSFGSTNGDSCMSVAADPSGNAIVAGYTFGSNFPLVGNGTQTARHFADSDAFVTKLNSAGDLVYSGLLGGDARETAVAVATDAAGNIYVAGTTASKNFPATDGAYQASIASHCGYPSSSVVTGFIGTITSFNTDDVFVTKLDPSGIPLLSTYLGGGCYDQASSIAIDAAGNIWIAGTTDTSPFHQVMPFETGPPFAYYKAFVTELDRSFSALLFSSYVSGGSQPLIAADPFGNTFVAGTTALPQSPYGGPPAPPGYLTGIHASVTKVLPQSPGPIVINGVGNAFTRRTGPVSPGQITLITAEGIAPDPPLDLTLTPSAPLPRTLSGVQVLFDGEAAPMISVAAGSVVAIAPYALAGKRQAAVQVVFQGQVSAPVLADVLPDVSYLSADGSGAGQAFARNPDGSLNSPQNPAPQSSPVTVYLTGLGRTDPSCPEGGVDVDATGNPPTAVTGYLCGVFQLSIRTAGFSNPKMPVPNSAVTVAVK